MNNEKGFSLTEFLLTITIILVVTAVAVPTLLFVIKRVRLNAFKTSALNLIDATEYYLAKTDYVTLTTSTSIKELELEMDNNNFDEGEVKEIDNRQVEIVYLKDGSYCAKGNKKNLVVSDKGCGKLDTTKPNKVNVYLVDQTSSSLTVVASAGDDESDDIYYEFSIDGSKYSSKSKLNKYVFENIKQGNHKVKVRATNEAGLIKYSSDYSFKNENISSIICSEEENIKGVSNYKNISCKFPSGNYIYEYSDDNINFKQLGLTQNKYTFNFFENKKLYLRVRNGKKIITSSAINVYNIDLTLNSAYPELLDNMIPVIYDNEKSVWIKADLNQRYYDYENKMWANAVFVRKYADSSDPKSKSRDYYLSSSATLNEIYEKDIIGFYVWIPRFKYILFNISGKSETRQIGLSFEGNDKNISTGQIDGTYYNSEWYTHPAFTTYSNINGFWVSKFDMSANKNTNCYIESNRQNCDKSDMLLYSIPDSSLTNISISNAYLSSMNMSKKGNIFGINNEKTNVITNLEWGAISYLTNSAYGINNNLENNGNYYKYNLNSSTTGNITGVFNLTGSYNQMVMGNYNKDAGLDKKNSSGFKNLGKVEWPDKIDYYQGITSKSRILGDATLETENWYNGNSEFVNGEKPFILRGGVMNNISSIYNFSSYTGSANKNVTFRTVITK